MCALALCGARRGTRTRARLPRDDTECLLAARARSWGRGAGFTHRRGPGLEKWLPGSAETLVVPDAYYLRERTANLAVVDAYFTSVVQNARANPVERNEIRQQLHSLAAAVRRAAEGRLAGGYATSLLERTTGDVISSITEALGDPVRGGLFRPLSSSELQMVLEAIDSDAARLEITDASSELDAEFSRTGIYDPDRATPAILAALHLADRLWSVGELNHPTYIRALRDLYATCGDASQWFRDTDAPLQDKLKHLGTEVGSAEKTRASLPQPPRLPKPISAGDAASFDRPATHGPAPPTSGSTWGRVMVLFSVVVALALAWAVSRSVRIGRAAAKDVRD